MNTKHHTNNTGNNHCHLLKQTDSNTHVYNIQIIKNNVNINNHNHIMNNNNDNMSINKIKHNTRITLIT